MVFPPTQIPDPEDFGIDSDARYVADTPADIKGTLISKKRHRWFDIRAIGDQQGPYQVGATGLAAGGLQRIQFDHKPDWIIISISGATANTGRCRLYLGEEGGPSIPLGPSGRASIPAPEGGIICLRNVGTTATFGAVVAVAGFDSQPSPDILCGN